MSRTDEPPASTPETRAASMPQPNNAFSVPTCRRCPTTVGPGIPVTSARHQPKISVSREQRRKNFPIGAAQKDSCATRRSEDHSETTTTANLRARMSSPRQVSQCVRNIAATEFTNREQLSYDLHPRPLLRPTTNKLKTNPFGRPQTKRSPAIDLPCDYRRPHRPGSSRLLERNLLPKRRAVSLRTVSRSRQHEAQTRTRLQ